MTDAQVLTTALVARFFGGNLVVAKRYMEQHWGQNRLDKIRKGIETSQLTARFPKQIHAVTAAGFALKIALFIFAHLLDQVGL